MADFSCFWSFFSFDHLVGLGSEVKSDGSKVTLISSHFHKISGNSRTILRNIFVHIFAKKKIFIKNIIFQMHSCNCKTLLLRRMQVINEQLTDV